MSITAERLREILDYSPDTGLFYWRERRRGRSVRDGGLAGSRARTRYVFIAIDRKPYLAHRLAWLYVHGRWPDDMLDHKNGIPSDNRLSNLRECSHAQNQRNQRVSSRSKSGIRGVSKKANRWQVQITHAGVDHYVGSYLDPEEARQAYISAAQRLHGEFARTD